jgi:adenine phosphoribosyltransferase
MDLKQHIRDIPDFPKPGIMFRDITTLIKEPTAFKHVVDTFANHYRDKGIDVVVGVESRGFIFGSLVAYELGLPFAIVRKPGKLPGEVIAEEYELEYGTDKLEMHKDTIEAGQNVLIIDDLLATGGTVAATARLIEKAGGKVGGMAFVVELSFLNGRDKLKGYDVLSLVAYDSE